MVAKLREIFETDVLIVGSEGAGAMAAIKASEGGAQVILATKGSDIGRSGATVTANVSNIAIDSRSVKEHLGLSGDPGDSPEAFFEDIVVEGKYLNDQKQVEALCFEAPSRARDLKDWGYKWDKVIGPSPGHRFPRACYGYPSTGPPMLKAMKKVIKASRSITLLPDLFVADLLCAEDGSLSGALAVDLKGGEMLCIKSKAVVMATGGGQNVYPYVSGPHDLTGDGLAMAYRAGAEMVDLEFIQFVPCALLWPPGWDIARHGPMPFLLAGHMVAEPHILNRKGERFLKRWDPARMEYTTRDILSIAVATEVAEGRGSKHGGVYFSMKHVPDDILDYYGEWGPCKDWKSAGGFDFRPLIEELKRGKAIEIGNYCHFFMGGINVDEWGRTNLGGLFAAGECCGLVNGANRLSGVALSQILVQGARAGRAAAEFSKGSNRKEPDPELVSDLIQGIRRPLERKKGTRPVDFRKKLQEIAFSKVGILRDEKRLKDALISIEALKGEAQHLATSEPQGQYNLEWLEALQTRNLLTLLEIIALSALYRRESRGAHYRLDFPYTDNDQWLKNVLIRRSGDSAAELYTRPPVITRLQPPGGRKPYP